VLGENLIKDYQPKGTVQQEDNNHYKKKLDVTIAPPALGIHRVPYVPNFFV
jgi:hypothetical protein